MEWLKTLRFAFRSILKHPGFAGTFILTLGLGIGANTSIFSVVHGVLLRPLPYPDADRIMVLRQPAELLGAEDVNFSFVEIADYRAQAKSIAEIVEFGDWTFNVLGRGEPQRATGGLVTSNFFSVLGLKPLLGRTLEVDDEKQGAEPVAVLTYEYWNRVFGRDLSVVGKLLDLTVKKARIVGILEPGSHYAASRRQDFYVNYASNEHYMGAAMQDDRRHRMTSVFAKLAPGVSVQAATQEIQQIHHRLEEEYPDAYPKEWGMTITVTPWLEELTNRARPTLIILLATAGFVLLIACSNVANLTLTRLVGRERELAIRSALGASGGRLRRLLLAENLLLALGGALVGLGVALLTKDLLISYTSRFTLRTGEISIDFSVLFFTVLVAFASALLFAWLPGFGFSKDLSPSLAASGGTRATGSLSRSRLQKILVMTQLALSFVLLVGAGLLLRSLLELESVDPGFELDSVLTMDAPDYSGLDQRQRRQFSSLLIEQVEGFSGVESAAVSSHVPLQDTGLLGWSYRTREGDPDPNGPFPPSLVQRVTPGYFETIGTSLLRGRDFADTDVNDSAPVAILSESMARHYFGEVDPLGRQVSVRLGSQDWGPWMTIVGIAANNKSQGVDREAPHTFYTPASQSFMPVARVLLRTAGDPTRYLRQVVNTIHRLDPNRPVDNVRTLEEARQDNIAPQRLNTTLFGIFALLALIIAAVGVGGILAFSVSQRRQEIGIRMALGASRGRVLRWILREGTLLAVAGLAVGGVGAAGLARFMSGLLFEVDPLDLPTLLGVGVVLLLVAGFASLIPALRASRVDPMEALRA